MATLTTNCGVGGVLDTEANVRTGLSGAAALSYEVSPNSDMSGSTVFSAGSVNSSTNFTGGTKFTGLTPKTKYYWTPRSDGTRLITSSFPSFNTQPAIGDPTPFKIVTSSCQNNSLETTIFASIAALNPNFFWHGGDFGGYGLESTALVDQWGNYQTQYASRFLTEIVPKVPQVHIVDDHDMGCTTAHDGNGRLPGVANALLAFQHYCPTYDLVNASAGQWQRARWGIVDNLFIDCRFQRDGYSTSTPNTFFRFPTTKFTTKVADTGSSGNLLVARAADSPSASDDAYRTWYVQVTTTSGTYYRRCTGYNAAARRLTLSASVPNLSSTSTYAVKLASMLDMDMIANGQVDWLITALTTTTQTWKILYSGLGWNPTAGTLGDDQWGGWDIERFEQQYIIQEIAAVSNLVIISADWHASGIDSGANSGRPEMSASPLNTGNIACRGTYDHSTDKTGHMFGLIEGSQYALTLTVKDADGTTTSAISPYTINLSAPPPDVPSPLVSFVRSA
jgi:hypothetical protein